MAGMFHALANAIRRRISWRVFVSETRWLGFERCHAPIWPLRFLSSNFDDNLRPIPAVKRSVLAALFRSDHTGGEGISSGFASLLMYLIGILPIQSK